MRYAFFQLNYSHLKKSSLHFTIVVWIDSLPFNTCAHKVYAVNHLHYKIFFKLLVSVRSYPLHLFRGFNLIGLCSVTWSLNSHLVSTHIVQIEACRLIFVGYYTTLTKDAVIN